MEPKVERTGTALRWEAAALGAAVGGLGAFLARDVGLYIPPLPASSWMLTMVLGALLWGTALRPALAAAVVLIAVLWIAVAWTRLTPVAAHGLVRRDPEEHADAILIFGSRLQKDGEPTAPAFDRLVHGLELMRQGWAPRLILSELPPPSAKYERVARRLMDNLGLTGEIVTIGPVHRTRDEAIEVGKLCRERGYCRILAVTSPTHSRRASEALEREGLTVFSSPAVETRFDLETLDRPEERLPAFASILHERLGLWYYRARGWSGGPGRSAAD